MLLAGELAARETVSAFPLGDDALSVELATDSVWIAQWSTNRLAGGELRQERQFFVAAGIDGRPELPKEA